MFFSLFSFLSEQSSNDSCRFIPYEEEVLEILLISEWKDGENIERLTETLQQ